MKHTLTAALAATTALAATLAPAQDYTQYGIKEDVAGSVPTRRSTPRITPGVR